MSTKTDMERDLEIVASTAALNENWLIAVAQGDSARRTSPDGKFNYNSSGAWPVGPFMRSSTKVEKITAFIAHFSPSKVKELLATNQAQAERIESMKCCGNCALYGVACCTGQALDINGSQKYFDNDFCDDWKVRK